MFFGRALPRERANKHTEGGKGKAQRRERRAMQDNKTNVRSQNVPDAVYRQADHGTQGRLRTVVGL